MIKKDSGISTTDPYCSRHETIKDCIDLKNEDRQCDELERTSYYELEKNPLHEEYHNLVDEELNNDVKEFVRKQSVDDVLPNENVEGNIHDASTIESLLLVEIKDQEVNLVEELANLPKDMELIEKRKFEANALLLTCKPLLFSLATSEAKETLDDQMLDDLQKFVTLADMYFVLTNPKVNDNKKKSVKFQGDVLDGKLNSDSVEGKLF